MACAMEEQRGVVLAAVLLVSVAADQRQLLRGLRGMTTQQQTRTQRWMLFCSLHLETRTNEPRAHFVQASTSRRQWLACMYTAMGRCSTCAATASSGSPAQEQAGGQAGKRKAVSLVW